MGIDFGALFAVPLVGSAFSAILILFIACVALGIYYSFKPSKGSIDRRVFLSTTLAGLVLSVASGVLGTPADVPGKEKTVSASVAALGAGATVTDQTPATPKPENDQSNGGALRLTDAARIAIRNLYTWIYLIIGVICCIIYFLVNTPNNDDLIKTVGVTTIGFFITLIKRL